MTRRQDGFTLVEVLTAMTIFGLISIGFYTTLFSGTQASETARKVVRVSEEARLGLNRMVRDAREADEIALAGDTSFRVLINFNNDFDVAGDPIYSNTGGNLEDVTYSFDPDTRLIYIDADGDGAASDDEVLASGVSPIPGVPMFAYYSNLLEFDWDANGVTTCMELDAATAHGVSGIGDGDGVCNAAEWPFLSRINFAMQVSSGDREANFYSTSQLRNFAYQPGSS